MRNTIATPPLYVGCMGGGGAFKKYVRNTRTDPGGYTEYGPSLKIKAHTYIVTSWDRGVTRTPKI